MNGTADGSGASLLGRARLERHAHRRPERRRQGRSPVAATDGSVGAWLMNGTAVQSTGQILGGRRLEGRARARPERRRQGRPRVAAHGRHRHAVADERHGDGRKSQSAFGARARGGSREAPRPRTPAVTTPRGSPGRGQPSTRWGPGRASTHPSHALANRVLPGDVVERSTNSQHAHLNFRALDAQLQRGAASLSPSAARRRARSAP
jgi:hypothetical protein